jgi:hypothetical protein
VTFFALHFPEAHFISLSSITAQSSKKIPKKWLCVGAHAPTHNHFFGYLWQWMRLSDATLRCNTSYLTVCFKNNPLVE